MDKAIRKYRQILSKVRKKRGIATLLILCFLLANIQLSPRSFIPKVPFVYADSEQTEEQANDTERDYELYEKYIQYKNYQKRKKYRLYKKYKKYKIEKKDKALYKDRYEKYKLYKKDSKRYKSYAGYYEYYKKYKNYKEKYSAYSAYAKYSKYDKDKYGRAVYSKYGTSKYKNGYDRYLKEKNRKDELIAAGSYGPDITVGLWNFSKSDLEADSFRITANKTYAIKDSAGNVIATIDGSSETRVKHTSGGNYTVYRSITDTAFAKEVHFAAANSSDENEIVFNLSPKPATFTHYRGKIQLRYSEASGKIWVINSLPLEQYAWGMGEITGTGDADYNRVMTTSFRTYGYWKIKYSTKYATEGFKVNATPGNQLYYGYDWEVGHTAIRSAVEETRGTIVMYGNEIAITPYSSWTDGRTRSWEERWGSKNYPWCLSVKDSYGKNPSMTTKQLEDAGNHMVGLSANGAVKLADDKSWSWSKILKYYYTGIDLVEAY